jgi:hypothetical protein
MHVINTAGATSVKNPRTDTVHEARPDGVFEDIPLDFAHELVTRHASQWREASAHEAALHQAQVEKLRNPHLVAPTLADHASRIEALESKVDALLAAQGDGGSDLPPAEDGDGAGPEGESEPGHPEEGAPADEAKPSRASKSAAAKKAAAKKAAPPSPPE